MHSTETIASCGDMEICSLVFSKIGKKLNIFTISTALDLFKTKIKKFSQLSFENYIFSVMFQLNISNFVFVFLNNFKRHNCFIFENRFIKSLPVEIKFVVLGFSLCLFRSFLISYYTSFFCFPLKKRKIGKSFCLVFSMLLTLFFLFILCKI